jgi:transposase, IS5 family
MKKASRKLFDEEFRLEKLSKQSDPLEKLSKHIDFEVFRKTLEGYFGFKEREPSRAGRRPYDPVMMFKILVLQRYYNLSDDAIEYAILDRLSFMRFLGLSLGDRVPDAKTVWYFKNQLAQGDLFRDIFKTLDRMLNSRGIIAHEGKMMDASFVEVPRQRNTREENDQIKEGEIPDGWEDDLNKLRQKDLSASWVTHNGNRYFGYKDHVKADTKTKLITAYQVTPAHVHDSNMITELLSARDKDQPLWADSAFRSQEAEERLKRKGIKSEIHEKGYRGKPLNKEQMDRNRVKSKVRARVEHIFAFMENSMNGMYLRSRNLVNIRGAIGMMNITYNLFRLTQLKVRIA